MGKCIVRLEWWRSQAEGLSQCDFNRCNHRRGQEDGESSVFQYLVCLFHISEESFVLAQWLSSNSFGNYQCLLCPNSLIQALFECEGSEIGALACDAWEHGSRAGDQLNYWCWCPVTWTIDRANYSPRYFTNQHIRSRLQLCVSLCTAA